jgi:general stress protein 26
MLTDPDAIKQACLEVMLESEAVSVTTLDEEGAPCTRAMFNLRRKIQFPDLGGLLQAGNDRLLVYLSTNTSSEKIRHIRRDPRVALYYCIPHTFHGAMLSGRVTEVHAQEVKDAIWQEGWEIYFPTGRRDPDYTILELCPSRIRGWLGDRAFDCRLETAG